MERECVLREHLPRVPEPRQLYSRIMQWGALQPPLVAQEAGTPEVKRLSQVSQLVGVWGRSCSEARTIISELLELVIPARKPA